MNQQFQDKQHDAARKRLAAQRKAPKVFNVPVTRTGYAHRTLRVVATSSKVAVQKALEAAGNFEYSENASDYEAEDGAWLAPNQDLGCTDVK